jgi:hypothetical protein
LGSRNRICDRTQKRTLAIAAAGGFGLLEGAIAVVKEIIFSKKYAFFDKAV